MSSTTGNRSGSHENNNINAEKVAQYLQANPDFFQHHENLLENLNVPHSNTGVAVSLIEKQVSLLRQQKNELDTQLQNLIQAARNNEQIINRMQRFTLDIIHAHSIEDIITLCQEEMQNNFNADYVGIKLIGNYDNDSIFIASDNDLLQSFTQFFKNRKPLCGRITKKQCQLMFPNHIDDINSAVLAPLQNAENIGIIALGSTDESRFQASMGTLFISHLAEIITASLSKHLKHSA
jgi:uncharacterized protein YigA (DUF484 family)